MMTNDSPGQFRRALGPEFEPYKRNRKAHFGLGSRFLRSGYTRCHMRRVAFRNLRAFL